MATEASLIKRVGIAKVIGLVIGIAGFFFIQWIWADSDGLFRLGFLLWYTTFGALIGMFGMVDFHPMLKFAMPFWFRGIVFGAWFNLVATLLAYDKIEAFLAALDFGSFRSPFWFVAEGAIVGLFIDWVATKYGGEGKALLD